MFAKCVSAGNEDWGSLLTSACFKEAQGTFPFKQVLGLVFFFPMVFILKKLKKLFIQKLSHEETYFIGQ